MVFKNKKLTVGDLPKQIPNFKNSSLPKDKLTEQWLIDWINISLENQKIKIGDILPNKNVIAQHLGISIGTVQNAIRYTEDKGYLQSKQKIGTLIAKNSFSKYSVKKQTSKRDAAISKVKKYIVENGIGFIMPPACELSKKINVSANTIRLAYLYLCDKEILEYSASKSGKKVLKIINLPDEEENYNSSSVRLSLVEKTSKELLKYIEKNHKKGDKLETREDLSKILKVSIKTVHDAINSLESKGILISRRGKYGTVIEKMPDESLSFQPLKERSIFAKASEAAFYRWEKIEDEILTLIKNDYEVGMKLPTMSLLAKKFQVSTNTIRKSLKTLADKGILDFERGRYGGTFIIDIPESKESHTYEWLAVNKKYIQISSEN